MGFHAFPWVIKVAMSLLAFTDRDIIRFVNFLVGSVRRRSNGEIFLIFAYFFDRFYLS